MEKKYYFLAGLHRSGNTVLSSILNQNPEIYSSPLSPVCDYMWKVHLAKHRNQSSIINTYQHRSYNVISKILNMYYYDVDKPIVIDREKNWATPANVELLKSYLSQEIKIIFTTRPLLDILASYISIDLSYIIKRMNEEKYDISPDLSIIDHACDFLMRPGEDMQKTMLSFKTISENKDKNIIHVVEYDDLLKNPEETLNNIYDFLNIKRFKHDFFNIKRVEKYDYSRSGLAPNLHDVRPTLSRSNIKIENVLSPYVIEKYKDYKYF